MDRKSIIASLIGFDKPLNDLRRELAELGWDWDADPLTVLTRQNLAAMIDRFLIGELDAETIESWANLIEGREDIVFESGCEATVAEALHDLANPELSGRLDAIATEVRARLNGFAPI